MGTLKPSPGQNRRTWLIALLVFLAALAPVGWLFSRMRHEAADRDYERLAGLAGAVLKSLNADAVANQRLMQTWRKQVAAAGFPLAETAWNDLFDGPQSRRLGRFRGVGYAVRDDNGRWAVIRSEGRDAREIIAVGTDLAEFPDFRAGMEAALRDANGEIRSGGVAGLPGIGNRQLAFVSLPHPTAGRALLYTTTAPEDFLSPVATEWVRKGGPGSPQQPVVLEVALPGTAEGLVTVDSIPPGGVAPAGRFPEVKWDYAFGRLHLLFRPGPAFARDSLRGEAWILLGGGGAVALLLAAMAWSQARQRENLRLRVETRTAELRDANAALGRYRAILETTGDLVALCEMDGTPIFMNRAGRGLLGIGPDESLTDFPLDRIHFPETLELFAREGIPHAMEHGSWSAEIDMRHRDGQRIPVAFEGVVIRSSTSDSWNLGCIARDITASRRLDRNLRESLERQRELVALKSQFVNTVSHEFRTPLGVILTSADILAHYLDRLTDEARREHLDDIARSCKHMSGMLEQVLDLGAIEAASASCQHVPLDLAALLSRITDESGSATGGGEIRLEIEPEMTGASGDKSLIRHIFLNLLSNARKYSPPGAAVDFTARREHGDAVFTVRDRGIGIPAADLPGLFESFSRGSNVGDIAGTGLGLAIVKRSVALHDGTISVQSAEGEGTTVTVRLPLFPQLP